MSKEIVKTIADALGDDLISQTCGVSDHSVRNARWQGRFPASWFVALEAACIAKGIDCPRSAFNFKSPSSEPQPMVSCPPKDVGTARADCKGAA